MDDRDTAGRYDGSQLGSLAAVAGAAVTVELGVVYAALSRGDTFIGAPTGALGAAIAVLVGMIGGDPIGPAVTLGLVCVLLGGGISARATPPRRQGRLARGHIGGDRVDRGRHDAGDAQRCGPA